MRSLLFNDSRPARRRTLEIAAAFDKKKEDGRAIPAQEASKAASVIQSSPVPTSPVESTPPNNMKPRQQIPDTPPASPRSSVPSGRIGQLVGETKQRYDRPQTPMDFTFQSMGFGMGSSRASLDDIRSQLAEVRQELKTMQEKLAEQDLEIKSIRSRLDQMIEMYERSIVDAGKTAKEKDELQDQVQRLSSAWREERQARQELEEEIEMRVAKERQLQAKLKRMSSQDSASVLARARRPLNDEKSSLRGRRGTVNGSGLKPSFPFNQSSPRELQL